MKVKTFKKLLKECSDVFYCVGHDELCEPVRIPLDKNNFIRALSELDQNTEIDNTHDVVTEDGFDYMVIY